MALLIVFFSATQLGFHFWPNSSLVYGIRIDYLSPTLYFLDILIFLFLFLRRLLDRKPGQRPSWDSEAGRSLLVGLPILLVNLIYSANPLASLSWSLHFCLYFLFVETIAPQFRSLRDSRRVIGTFCLTLLATMVFEVGLGALQFYLGHSVGGLLYYLGERNVAVGAPGIATTSFMGNTVLRAYGTFGHPNVLAGWSVLVLLIILQLRPQFRSLRDSRRVIGTFVTLLTTIIIFLTQSRAAALALFGLVIPFSLIKQTKHRLIYFLIFICSMFFVLPRLTLPRSDLSTSERLSLQGVSLKAISHFPIFGTGSNASINTYPLVSPNTRLLQPDHDSLTLFLSWFGIFGVLAILYFLRPFNIRHSLFSVLTLAPLLVLDHYLLTSPQGLFILLFYLRVTMSYEP